MRYCIAKNLNELLSIKLPNNVPVTMNFDHTDIVGYAHSFEIKDNSLHADIDWSFDEELPYGGDLTIGYITNVDHSETTLRVVGIVPEGTAL
jgi:hypothetical protein